MKVWEDKEYKQNREKKLKEKCELCSSTKDLIIHHWFKILPYKMRVRSTGFQIFNDLITQGIYDDFKKLGKGSCPKCNRGFYERKTIKPIYKCYKCGYEFDIPIKDRIPRFILNSIYTNFRFMNWEAIGIIANDKHQEVIKRYKDMWWKDINTLCKKCHYKIHKDGQNKIFEILQKEIKYM